MKTGMELMLSGSPTRGENLAERLRRAKRSHLDCALLTCDKDRSSDKCDCGADGLNALLEEAAAAIQLAEAMATQWGNKSG